MTSWLVVVPIRRFTTGKTRLGLDDRGELARAVALDTLDALGAVSSVRRVLVVTDDPAEPAWPTGVLVRPQRRHGLSSAIAEGLSAARLLDPSAATAVVLGDLPLIAPGAVTAVLAAAERVPVGFVRDAAGTGTTMWTMAPDQRVEPAFGGDSAARHRRLGARELLAGAALRQDLDTAHDLAVARRAAGRRLTTVLASGPATT